MDEKKKAVISAAIILAVNVAALFGVQLDADLVHKVVFGVISIATTIYGVWKNHNFTPEAAKAQAYLDMMKEGYDG